jgi:hypothetical protein
MSAPPRERALLKLNILGEPVVGALLVAAGKVPAAARVRFAWYRSGCVAHGCPARFVGSSR